MQRLLIEKMILIKKAALAAFLFNVIKNVITGIKQCKKITV